MYEYVCDSCGNKFEDLRRMVDRYEAPCPACEDTARMVISSVRLDENKMGMDPDFPSAYRRWGEKATRRMRGLDPDPANKNLEHFDYEKGEWEGKKRFGG